MVQQFCPGTQSEWQVWLCLDPARLNKVLIRPVDKGLTFNDVVPRLAGVR